MAIENAEFIGGLDPKWPELDADISEGDDHLRLLKEVLIKTFGGKDGNGFAKAITATEDEINFLGGTTSNLQDQLTALDGSKVGNVGSQVIDGQLTIDGSLVVIGDEDHGFGGMNIKRFATGHEWGALFNLADVSGHVHIRQVGDLATSSLGNPETQINMFDGQVQVQSSGSTDPTTDRSLIPKKWAQDNFFEKETDGSIQVLRKVHVIDDGTSEGQGFGIYSGETEGDLEGSFALDGGTNAVTIAQKGAGSVGVPETFLQIEDGNIRLSSATTNTLPKYTNSLLDYAYCWDTFAPKANLLAAEAMLAAGETGSFIDGSGKTVTVTDGIITDLG
ncbi:hypothetical protein DRQ25_10035 [Candidatus Fermentibacteria bacterium]|nr:MAG: hypothetical protein DRQ25_10035 [Candidatus Fermentibacteria bacterium]